MNRKIGLMLGVALLVLGAAAAADDPFEAGTATRQDLSDMKDGETRTFGEGKAQVTAIRKGDDIEISFPGEDGARSLHCKAGSGSCFVTTHGDGEHGAIIVKHGTTDLAQESAFVWTSEGGDGKSMAFHPEDGEREIQVIAEVDDEGGEPKVTVISPGDAGAVWDVQESGAAGDGTVKIIRVEIKGSVLRCPEGDTTMRVEEGDTATYLCPKHNVALEKAKGPGTFEHGVKVRTEPKREE